MKKLTVLWLFQAMVSLTVALGADPIPRADGPVVVQPFNPFPTFPSQPDDKKDPSTPKTDPDAVTVLPDEYLLIVKSEPEFILRASPKGKVEIIRATSPQVGGRFVGGNGKFKLETFKEKNVAIVMKRPEATGLVELIYSPVGAKDESTDIARMVQLGTGPIPPPKPIPDDDKKDPKPVVVKTFRVIMVYESADTLPAAANSVLYGKAVEEFLNANCTGGKAGWARRDKDATGAYDADRQAVWDAVKDEFGPPKNTKTPALVIQVNDKITIEPFAATAAATVTLLKKYAEGK